VDCEVKVADFGNPNLNTNVVLTVGASPADFSFVVRSVPGGRPDAIAG